MNTLEDILEAAFTRKPDVVDIHGQLSTDLPTFGGPRPDDTVGVWSWDETRLLVGTGPDDLHIVRRDGLY